jgi:hypothetical protein
MNATSKPVLLVARGGPAGVELDRAVALASLLDAQLAGLFIEDEALLRMAALPITREVGALSGAVRPLELADVERLLRRDAVRLREALSGLNVPWSFRVERGEIAQRTLAALPDAAVAIVSAQPAAHLRREPTRPPTVLVALGGDGDDERTMDIGAQLAAGARLSVAIAEPDPERFEQRRRQAEAQRPGLLAGASAIHVHRLDAPDLSPLMRALGATVLVLGPSRPGLAPEPLRRLLALPGCSLVLVS